MRAVAKGWDWFLEYVVQLIVLWAVLAAFVAIGVQALVGHSDHSAPSGPAPLIQVSDVDSSVTR